MKYCTVCKAPAKYPIDKYCRGCGNKIIDMPVEKCECGNIPKDFDRYCRNCGKQVKIKEIAGIELKTKVQ